MWRSVTFASFVNRLQNVQKAAAFHRLKYSPVHMDEIASEGLVGGRIERNFTRCLLQTAARRREDQPPAVIPLAQPGTINLQNLGLSESGVQGNGDDAPELGGVVFVLLDLLQPALVGFMLDREQLLLGGNTLAVLDVRQFNPLQPVLVQLVKIDREIQYPHEHIPLSANGPGRRLRFEPGGDVVEAIFGREGVESALAEARQQVGLDDGFRPRQVKSFLDPHGLPVEREEVLERD